VERYRDMLHCYPCCMRSNSKENETHAIVTAPH
jgi:hypothetical protein